MITEAIDTRFQSKSVTKCTSLCRILFDTLPYRDKEKCHFEYFRAVRYDRNMLFNITPESFHLWSSAFYSSVHIFRNLSEIEKLHCLRASMDAESDLTHEFNIIFSSDNSTVAYFETLYDLLKRFGDLTNLLAVQQVKL